MSLVADYESDSETENSPSGPEEITIKTEIKKEPKLEPSSEESDNDNVEDKKLPTPAFSKLPAPTFNVGDSNSQSGSGLVFANPFLVEEHAKEAILEKHVKMINTKNVAVINGKKICWNYRKGRCRFGHNCKFAHDSDLQKSKEQLNAELQVARSHSVVCQSDGLNPRVSQQPEVVEDNKNLELAINSVSKKRKRPGLTPGLVPGKRVMKQYLNNKT